MTSKVRDAEILKLEEKNILLADMVERQKAALISHQKLEEIKKEISEVHTLNVSLTAELEDYRTQTRRLLEELHATQQENARLVELSSASSSQPQGGSEVCVCV